MAFKYSFLIIRDVEDTIASLRGRRSIKPGASDSDRRARAKSVTRGKSACLLSRARVTRVLAKREDANKPRAPRSLARTTSYWLSVGYKEINI